jgi:hypothetical protein
MCLICKGQDCLIFEGGTNRLSRKSVNNCQSTLRNIPEERRSHLHGGGSLESRMVLDILHFYESFLLNLVLAVGMKSDVFWEETPFICNLEENLKTEHNRGTLTMETAYFPETLVHLHYHIHPRRQKLKCVLTS